MFCSQKKINEQLRYKANISYYIFKLGQKHNETIMIDEIESNDSLSYVYHYLRLKETKDILTLFKDSVKFNNHKISFVEKKKLTLNHDTLEIDKYLCEYDNTSIHVYINKGKGLLLTRNRFNNVTVEYHLGNVIDSIPRQIVNDSIFFSKD
jgi:hypothetical protein